MELIFIITATLSFFVSLVCFIVIIDDQHRLKHLKGYIIFYFIDMIIFLVSIINR